MLLMISTGDSPVFNAGTVESRAKTRAPSAEKAPDPEKAPPARRLLLEILGARPFVRLEPGAEHSSAIPCFFGRAGP